MIHNVSVFLEMLEQLILLKFFFFPFLFKATPAVYGSSQARDQIRAGAAGLHHSHSKAKSKPHLRPTPQLTTTWDP